MVEYMSYIDSLDMENAWYSMNVRWARRERRKSPLATLFYVRRDRAVRSGLAHLCSARQRHARIFLCTSPRDYSPQRP